MFTWPQAFHNGVSMEDWMIAVGGVIVFVIIITACTLRELKQQMDRDDPGRRK